MNEVKLARCRQQVITEELARKKAEAASKAKSEFLAHMSHEIRTPLSGLLGLLRILDSNQLSDEDQRYLKMAEEAGCSLLFILNDILDLSKIEENLMKLEEIEFSPRKVALDVIQLLSIQTQKKGVEMKLDVSQSIPDLLLGDPTRFRQILLNLVSNSVKFTEKGHVSIKLEV